MLQCTKCKRRLSETDFYIDKRRGKPYTRCKACWKQVAKKWAEDNPEKRKAIYSKSSGRLNVERYGLTYDDYLRSLEEQDGLCAICGLPERKVVYGRTCRLSIDHDHTTGEVRALLCSSCNGLLGFAGDDVELLEKAIHYLMRHRKENI